MIKIISNLLLVFMGVLCFYYYYYYYYLFGGLDDANKSDKLLRKNLNKNSGGKFDDLKPRYVTCAPHINKLYKYHILINFVEGLVKPCVISWSFL